uniref:Uncharacterized protein n=1 Tax=Eutreptiella gymnastica TaxID=73025 RepID=A0A7S4FIR9_9EUGL
MHPSLYDVCIPGLLSARHCAASCANQAALCTLLERPSGVVDRYWKEDRLAQSLWIMGMGLQENDLYIHQSVLTYNGKSVYVGHTHGKYIYY